MAANGVRIGIEIGGTFTDWVVADGGRVVGAGKVLSTAAQPEQGAFEALTAAGGGAAAISEVVHGSTVATNAVLEHRGAKTALVTTRGFRDVVNIQRQGKQRLFDLRYRQPEPLVTRDCIVEADERLAPDGSVVAPIDLDELRAALRPLLETSEVASVAVTLLHSYANPEHEHAVGRLLQDMNEELAVSLSVDVSPQLREYERTSTTTLSAYIKPVVSRYLAALESGFNGNRDWPLTIVQGNGGSLPAGAARRHCISMLLSGPAAGVIGAAATARALGVTDAISFDMGGTSCDVSVISDGRPTMTTTYRIDGLPIQVPLVDVVTVGAGGGSIARIDEGGLLKVGPESAAADPGPVCYGRGGEELTITDANVAIGLIRPSVVFGGRIRPAVDAVREAIERFAAAMSLEVDEAAMGVRAFANATMAQAVRLVSIERGLDPRRYALVAYGGSGPLHGAEVADQLGIPTVIVPSNPGIQSATGLLIADTQRDYVATSVIPYGQLTREVIADRLEQLERRAHDEFVDELRKPWEDVELERSVDMRYAGQAYELTVPMPQERDGGPDAASLLSAFHGLHRRRYGYATSDERVEAVSFRLRARVRSPMTAITPPAPARHGTAGQQTGELALGGERVTCRFLERRSLPYGHELRGPAVLEEETATTYVPPGWDARVEQDGSIVMTRAGGGS